MRKRFVAKVIENLSNIINNQNGHTLLLQMMEKMGLRDMQTDDR